ncbi:hypothetical protein D3C73_821700 [compost metagenome]
MVIMYLMIQLDMKVLLNTVRTWIIYYRQRSILRAQEMSLEIIPLTCWTFQVKMGLKPTQCFKIESKVDLVLKLLKLLFHLKP